MKPLITKNRKISFHILIVIVFSIVTNLLLTVITLPKGTRLFVFEQLTNRPFWIAVILIMLLYLIFYFLPKNYFILSISFLNLFLILLAIVNMIKIDKRNEPILPQDIYLVRESLNIALEYLNIANIFILIAIGIFYLSFAVFVYKMKINNDIKILKRVVLSIVSISLLFGAIKIKDNKIWDMMGLSKNYQSPIDNLQKNGFVIANFFQILNKFHEKPEGYSNEIAESLIKKFTFSNYDSNFSTKESPNIIVVQLEAFFDPTKLPGVEFNQDPIPFFRKISDQYTSGTLGVNIFAGGTANTEFEVLTSLHTKLFAYDTVPFISHVQQPMESAAWVMKQQGYETSGIHNHENWFYNRDKVYPYLGLTHTVFREDLKDPVIIDNLALDTELSKAIIHRTSETKSKDFIMAVGVESHGPYPGYDVPSYPIQITKSSLTKEIENTVENFSNKLKGVDNAIQELITYYENQNEPTIIVMFGDHLPLLGDDHAAFLESGYLQKENNLEKFQKTYSTPLVIWDNYRKGERKELHIGTTFLMPYLFKDLGIVGNPIQTFLQDKMEKGIMNLPSSEFEKDYGWKKEWIEDYRFLQYYFLEHPVSTK